MKTDILKLAEETSGMPEDNFFTIEGVKLTDEAVDLLYDLQDDENSNIESLRDIRHLLDLLKVRSAPGH